MLPAISGCHAAYQNFVVENLRKYYPDPSSIPASTGDIIERCYQLKNGQTLEMKQLKTALPLGEITLESPLWGIRHYTEHPLICPVEEEIGIELELTDEKANAAVSAGCCLRIPR